MADMKKTAFLLLCCVLVSHHVIAGSKGKHCLWKAVSPDGGTVYLLGSVHILPPDAYPLAPVIESAFRESTTAVFEVDFETMQHSGSAVFAAGALPEGKKLDDMLSEDTRKILKTYLDSEGLSSFMVESMRPWMAALSLTALQLVKLGYSPDNGVDITLARRASTQHKKIIGLESAEEQIALFSGLDAEQSEAFLRYTIRDLEGLEKDLGEIIDAWKNGNTAVLRKLLGEAFIKEPEVFRRFVTARNEKWMPKILPLFEKDRVSMVVVGTLHLVGEDGILEKLRKAGIDVEQL